MGQAERELLTSETSGRAEVTDVTRRRARLALGFTSVREILSYALGAASLVYGLEFSAPERAYLAVGAGLALLGAPIIGGAASAIFEKKGQP